MAEFFPEGNESVTGSNVSKTKDDEGYPTTIVERGNQDGKRLIAEFGKDGERYCRIISDKLTVSSGDAVVKTIDKEDVVAVKQGNPAMEAPKLEETTVKPIKYILVKEEGVDEGYYNLLDRVTSVREVKEEMESFGVSMGRVEEGVLAHSTDYTFRVGEDSTVVVNAGERKYIKSEGPTSLQVTKGTVSIETKNGDKKFSIVIRID